MSNTKDRFDSSKKIMNEHVYFLVHRKIIEQLCPKIHENDRYAVSFKKMSFCTQK